MSEGCIFILIYYNQLSPYWKKDYDKNVGIYTKEYEKGEITYDDYVKHINKYYDKLIQSFPHQEKAFIKKERDDILNSVKYYHDEAMNDHNYRRHREKTSIRLSHVKSNSKKATFGDHVPPEFQNEYYRDGGYRRNKAMTMKDIKELCKANQIKLSKVVDGKRVVYKKKELITRLKRKKLL